MLKRGLVISAAGLGVLLLGGVALASTKPKPSGGVPNPTPEDPHSQEACNAYKQQRTSIKSSCDALRAQIYELDAQRIEAASNEQWDLVAQLDAARAGLNGQLGSCNAQVSQLDNLIAGCA